MSTPDYLEDVNIPRLRKALILLGAADNSDEFIAANLATYVNLLTRQVVNVNLQENRIEPPSKPFPPGSNLDIQEKILWHIAQNSKRGAYPRSDILRREGFLEAARLVDEAYALFELAHKKLTSPSNPENSLPQQSQALLDVAAERCRQVEAEGYDHEHDDSHVNDEIAAMATYYAMPHGARDWDASSAGYGKTFGEAIIPEGWAVASSCDRRRELVKAGALILAEIERIDRATQ